MLGALSAAWQTVLRGQKYRGYCGGLPIRSLQQWRETGRRVMALSSLSLSVLQKHHIKLHYACMLELGRHISDVDLERERDRLLREIDSCSERETDRYIDRGDRWTER